MTSIESLMRELDLSDDSIATVLNKLGAAGELDFPVLPRIILSGNGDGDA